MELLTYILWWAFFGIIHTLTTLDWIKNISPLKGRAYRILYNTIAVVTLWITLKNVPGFTPIVLGMKDLEGLRLYIVIILYLAAAVAGALGLMVWDLAGFIGLTNDDRPLNTGGIYSFSRHPVYLAALLAFIAGVVTQPGDASLSWLLGAGGYFVIGSFFEESKLRQVFDEYQEYQKNVGRFFPYSKRHFRYIFSGGN